MKRSRINLSNETVGRSRQPSTAPPAPGAPALIPTLAIAVSCPPASMPANAGASTNAVRTARSYSSCAPLSRSPSAAVHPSACCCPLAPAHRSASGLAINICDVLVEEGGPRVEAKRRGGDPLPRASCRAKFPERAGSRVAGWVSGSYPDTHPDTRDEHEGRLGGCSAVSARSRIIAPAPTVQHPGLGKGTEGCAACCSGPTPLAGL